MPPSHDIRDFLDAAAARGIVSDAQRDELLALAEERAARGLATADRGGANAPREARPGVNAVTAAYALGALLVVSALAWLLFENWRDLGDAGVLAVSVGYVALFAGVGIGLRKRGWETAGSLAIALAVGTVAVPAWSLMRIGGLWPEDADHVLRYYPPARAWGWIPVDLSVVGAALVALRRVRAWAIGIPLAAATFAFLLHIGVALGDPDIAPFTSDAWLLVTASTLFAIAYAIERGAGREPDLAWPFYLAALVAGVVGFGAFLGPDDDAAMHTLPVVAAFLLLVALRLRRRMLLVASLIAAFGYVAYLAAEVFDDVIGFPVALAGGGILLIVAAVWAQRRFPALARRDEDEPVGALPGRGALALLPLAAAVAVLVVQSRGASARLERIRLDEVQAWRERRAAILRGDTTVVPRSRLPRPEPPPDPAPTVPGR